MHCNIWKWTSVLLACTVVTPAELLRSWWQEQSSRQGDIGRVRCVGERLLILFVCHNTQLFGLRFKWYIMIQELLERQPFHCEAGFEIYLCLSRLKIIVIKCTVALYFIVAILPPVAILFIVRGWICKVTKRTGGGPVLRKWIGEFFTNVSSDVTYLSQRQTWHFYLWLAVRGLDPEVGAGWNLAFFSVQSFRRRWRHLLDVDEDVLRSGRP
jgi:hypothetical protein